MDKGLDIGERRCVLAFQAAVPDNRRKQTEFSRAFVRSRIAGEAIATTAQALSTTARQLHVELDWKSADRALRWAERSNAKILTIFDAEYPALLAEIAAPPIVLFVLGRVAALRLPSIAIVGARQASHVGSDIAFRIGRDISAAHFSVTSGLARGIDAAAHRGALATGGSTIAVFGAGIDRIYPNNHQRLAEEIAVTGLLISEFPLGCPPRPYNFPRRNRVISGLSLGTLVVEAALKSGSISTAMHALEQGRDVFAVPGSIRNPMTAGCHRLIKQGAILVDDVEDILAHLEPARRVAAALPATSHGSGAAKGSQLSAKEHKVAKACEFESATFDEIVQRARLTSTEVSSILSALEVRGLVRSLPGNTYLKVAE